MNAKRVIAVALASLVLIAGLSVKETDYLDTSSFQRRSRLTVAGFTVREKSIPSKFAKLSRINGTTSTRSETWKQTHSRGLFGHSPHYVYHSVPTQLEMFSENCQRLRPQLEESDLMKKIRTIQSAVRNADFAPLREINTQIEAQLQRQLERRDVGN